MGQLIWGIVVWGIRTIFGGAILQVVSSFLMFFSIQAFITWGMGGDIFPEWATPTGFVNAMNAMKSGLNDGMAIIENKTFFASASQMIYYFIDYVALEYCAATALNAAVTRFLIRRIFK